MSSPEMIRIGYVLKRYPRFSETFVVNEILAHEAAGLPVEILALRPVTEPHFQEALARVRAPVTYIPERLHDPAAPWALLLAARERLPGFWDAFRRVEHADAEDVAQAIQVALLAQANGIVHLHAHFATLATTVARLAASFAGITYSFTAHAKDIYHRYDEPVRLALKLRDAAHAVTVSDYNLRHLRTTHGTEAARLVRIYNGLDLARLPWEDPGIRPPAILAVGRLVEKKGFDVLVEACRILRGRGSPFTARVIGEGPERAVLAAQIERSGLAGVVTLAGAQPQAEVFAAMRGAAVLAMPSVVSENGDRDGLPTVLLEAMALGTPCVASDVTGLPELVRDGETGLCVPEGDPDRLADAIERLLGDAALRSRLARAARARVERDFDIHRNAARLRALFHDAVAARSAARRSAA